MILPEPDESLLFEGESSMTVCLNLIQKNQINYKKAMLEKINGKEKSCKDNIGYLAVQEPP